MASNIDHPAMDLLRSQFPQANLRVNEFRGMVTVACREGITPVCMFLRDEPKLKYDMLAELEWRGLSQLSRRAPSLRRQLWFDERHHNNRLWLKVYLDPTQDTAPKGEASSLRDEDVIEKGDPGLKVESVCSIWPGAEWMEREVYDMYGIIFTGHPDLRRIMTWNGFGSYPLRKDYPMRRRRGAGRLQNHHPRRRVTRARPGSPSNIFTAIHFLFGRRLPALGELCG